MIRWFCFLSLIVASNAYAIEIMREHNGVTFAKYLYNGSPIWNDWDKAEIIANASCATKTVTEADFTYIYPDSDVLALSSTIVDGSMLDGNSVVIPGFKTPEKFKWFKDVLLVKPVTTNECDVTEAELQEALLMGDTVKAEKLKSKKELLERRVDALP